jgi:hypothetical protein
MSLTRCLLLSSCLILSACAEGKKEDPPVSDVTITASHFMYGLGGDQLITDYPIPMSVVGTDAGFLSTTEDSTYTIKRTGTQASSSVGYHLEEDGSFYLVVPTSGAPTRYLGAYQQTGAGDLTQAFFFTDRYAPTSRPVVGFFWGTRSTTGHDMSDARDDWHVFSHHVIFSSSSSPNPNNIGRSFYGSLTIAEDAGKDDVITGTGFESSSPNAVTLSGTARALDTIGEIDFSLLYNADSRGIGASQAKDLILGLDRDETDGEIGLFGLVRKFEFGEPGDPDIELDKAKTALSGRWHIGLHTTFVAPTAAGIDAANGTLTISKTGGFKIEIVGSQGPGAGEDTYTGTWAFDEISPGKVWSNSITLSVDGTNETWHAAVDREYGALVLVDMTVEARPSGPSQLNIGLAIKEPVVSGS